MVIRKKKKNFIYMKNQSDFRSSSELKILEHRTCCYYNKGCIGRAQYTVDL